MTLWATMGLNKYSHCAHTCSQLSSRDAQGAQSSLEISPFLRSTANLCSGTDTDLPQELQPGNLLWPEISEETMKGGQTWILAMRKAKEVLR